MPFDPKLVQQAEAPLDAAGELQLPEDLLELAAQLGDDAQYLAKLYPAHDRVTIATAQGSSHASDEESQSIGLLSAVPVAKADGEGAPEQASVGAGEKNTVHIRRTSRRLFRAVALVASLAAFAAGATLWYPRGENDPQPRNLAATPERATTEVTHLTSNNDATDNTLEPISLPPARLPASSPAPAPPAPATRDTFLHEYSGPELEGIYDLIGDAEDDKISI